jgi:hypothetical protein
MRKTGIHYIAIVLLLVASITISACAGLTAKNTQELSSVIAETTYVAAAGYYQANKGDFTPENAAKFQSYLLAFRLALDTGQSTTALINRWYQFYAPPSQA